MRIRTLPYWIYAGLGVAVAGSGCETTDVGKACTGMKVPYPGGATSSGDVINAFGSQIVEYNASLPCESGICVATIGNGGYCSRMCSHDSDCPQAMQCAEVMTQGPFANNTYCIWRQCQTDADCGDPWTIGCKPIVPYSSFMLCTFRQ